MDLFSEFRALVVALDEAGVPYATCGALALAVYGVPRATTDIDLLVLPADLAPALLVAERRGFTLRALPMTFRDGMEIQRVMKSSQGEALMVDLILVDDNLAPVWATRQPLDLEGPHVWVISRDALIQMKTWAGRPQDIGDIERLKELDR